MKRTIIAFILAITLLSGCGSSTNSAPPQSDVPSADSTSEVVTSETSIEPELEEIAYEVTYSSAITYKNSIGTVWAQAIFEVENTGSAPLYMSSGAYDLEDLSGKLISSRTMVSVYPTVIAPGEKAYYYEDTTLDGIDDALDVKILPRPKADKAKVDLVRFNVTDVELVDEAYGGIKAKGRVENATDEAQKMAYIAIILFDSSDKPIGVLMTILMDELAAGDKIGFEASTMTLPDGITTENVTRFEAYSYPTQMQF